MSNAAQPFSFGQFVPGFDFLKSLTGAGAGSAGAASQVSGVSSWIAPTLSEEEVDKRIKELKVVQFWLEQNLNALKATIQALEVQKMTLGTLKGMNLRMEDLANAFTSMASVPAAAAAARAPAPSPAAAPEPAPAAEAPAEKTSTKAAKPTAGVVDPMQWWNALTEQFQGIANTAMQEAANLKVPGLSGAAKSAAPAKGKAAAARKPAATARKRAKPARKRASPTNKG